MRHSIAMKLTPKTDKAILSAAKQAGAWVVKVWPDGVTFSETGGFTDFNVMYPAIQAAAEAGFVIALHCEQPGGNIDTYAREETFLEKALRPLVADFPGARFNIEHVSTRRMLEFVGEQPANITAGITLHHAISTRNDVLEWRPQKSGRTGLNPWNHCRPPLQTFDDRDAIQRVVLNADQTANRKFHFGPDSALHLGPTKLCSCGCPGVFSIPTLAALVVELFEQNGKLDHPAFRAFTVRARARTMGSASAHRRGRTVLRR
jgi:dihydroorotase